MSRSAIMFVAAALAHAIGGGACADDAVRSLGRMSACTCKFELECSDEICETVGVDSAHIVGQFAVNDDYIYAVYSFTWEEDTIHFAVADRRQSETTYGGTMSGDEMSLDHIEDDFSDWKDESAIGDVVYFLLEEHGDVEATQRSLDECSRRIATNDPPHRLWKSWTCKVTEGFTEPSEEYSLAPIEEFYRIASELPPPPRT